MPISTTISEYILKRLKEINIDVIFGVPGDFNMPFLDFIDDDKELTWGANTNELNAASAADGYARVRGAGALVTTFGVGELNAMNGIAGAYAEMVPIIHIVGAPSTSYQAKHAILHHTLGNGDFHVYTKMAQLISAASANITLENAASQIDEVITTAFIKKRPGYLTLPTDLMTKKISVPRSVYDRPLMLKLPPNPPEIQAIVLKSIMESIEIAKRPTLVIDIGVLRFHLRKKVHELVKRSGFPTFITPMGKGAVDECLPNFRGTYFGSISLAGVREEIEQADLIIEVGPLKSDFNTGGFTYGLEKIKTISLHSFSTTIHHAEYPNVGMTELIPLITAKLQKPCPIEFPPRSQPPGIDRSTNAITHNYLWKKIEEYIPVNSILVSDTGSAEFNFYYLNSPKETIFINQLLWNSIGYSVGATLGAAMADRAKKVYLFIGDGSYQVSATEISTFLRQGITPVIFLINNDGYLMERTIHGPHRDYNNVPTWEYSQSFKFFGGHLEHNGTGDNKHPSLIGVEARVNTRREFERVMSKVQQRSQCIHFIEVIMPKSDAPDVMLKFVDIIKKSQ